MTSPAGEEPRPSKEPGGSSRPGVEYVVMSREDLEFSGWSDSALASSGSNYRRIYEDETHLILELF